MRGRLPRSPGDWLPGKYERTQRLWGLERAWNPAIGHSHLAHLSESLRPYCDPITLAFSAWIRTTSDSTPANTHISCFYSLLHILNPPSQGSKLTSASGCILRTLGTFSSSASSGHQGAE